MLVLAFIIGIILFIAMIPVGVDASFLDNAFNISTKVGPFRYKVFPTGDQVEKEAKKAAKKVDKKSEKQGAKLTAQQLMQLVKPGLRALGRIRRKMRIQQLTLHYLVAGEDPYRTALQYGYITAAMNALRPLSDQVLEIRHKDIRTDVSFETNQPVISARLIAVIAIGDIVIIGLTAANEYRKLSRAWAKTAAGGTPKTKNERTSDHGQQ